MQGLWVSSPPFLFALNNKLLSCFNLSQQLCCGQSGFKAASQAEWRHWFVQIDKPVFQISAGTCCGVCVWWGGIRAGIHRSNCSKIHLTQQNTFDYKIDLSKLSRVTELRQSHFMVRWCVSSSWHHRKLSMVGFIGTAAINIITQEEQRRGSFLFVFSLQGFEPMNSWASEPLEHLGKWLPA